MRSREYSRVFGVSLALLAVVVAVLALLAQAEGEPHVAAIIQLPPHDSAGVSPDDNTRSLAQFEIARNTQAELLKSEFVLQSVLSTKTIAGLKIVAKHEPHAVRWLQRALEVEFPEHSELVVLRLRDATGDLDELKEILNQVVMSIRREVVGVEHIRREEASERLQELQVEMSQAFQSKLAKYFTLKQELGGEGGSIANAELEMLKLSLEVEREVLKDLMRAVMVRTRKRSSADQEFRVLQPAAVVE